MLSEKWHYVSVALNEVVVVEQRCLGINVIVIIVSTLQSHGCLLSIYFHLSIIQNSSDCLVTTLHVLLVVHYILDICLEPFLFLVQASIAQIEAIEVQVIFLICLLLGPWRNVACPKALSVMTSTSPRHSGHHPAVRFELHAYRNSTALDRL